MCTVHKEVGKDKTPGCFQGEISPVSSSGFSVPAPVYISQFPATVQNMEIINLERVCFSSQFWVLRSNLRKKNNNNKTTTTTTKNIVLVPGWQWRWGAS